MNQLALGLMPTTDMHDNKVLGGGGPDAGGWLGCCRHCRGDWQWYCELFAFPDWNGAERMCWMCLASSVIAHLRFIDCYYQAGRRSTKFTHETYLARMKERGLPVPAVMLHIIGFRLECIVVDYLHAYGLGVSGHIIGNILWETVRYTCWGATTQDANCAWMAKDLDGWYKRTKYTSILRTVLKKETVRPDGEYPKLRGAKANASCHVAPYALEFAIRFSDGTMHDELKVNLAEIMCRLDEITMSSGRFLSDVVAKEFSEVGNNMIKLYSVLSAEAFAQRKQL